MSFELVGSKDYDMTEDGSGDISYVAKPQLCEVRAELEKTLLSEDAPTLKQFEKWFAKGHNAAIKKALKIIDAHLA